MVRIIFDTDIGICNDDCQALVLALASRRFEIEGISVCAGNLTMRQSLYNALSLVEYLGRPALKVYPGEALPLEHVYGDFERQAFGTWGEDAATAVWPFGYPAGVAPQETRAAEWIRDAVLASPGEITLLALGPLTNIATALSHSSETAAAIREVVCMGGVFPEVSPGPGNITPRAEFNFWVDPHAAAQVLEAAVPLRLVPLNLTRQLVLDEEECRRFTALETRVGRLYATTFEAMGKANMRLSLDAGDALVVAACLWSELFTWSPHEVEVATESGSDYGASTLLPATEATRIRVAVDCDMDEVRSRYLECVSPRVPRAAGMV